MTKTVTGSIESSLKWRRGTCKPNLSRAIGDKKRASHGYRLESQTSHFSVADAGFEHMQVEHVQLAPFVDGAFIPAAAQLKVAGGAAGAALGRGASHTVHLSLAESGWESMHVEHVQSFPEEGAGALSPAADQSKVVGGAAGAALGRGASHTVHLSFAESG